MDTISYKTVSANKENANKKWWVVDAEGQTLGRLASNIAFLLRGKHKTNFTPHADCGDYVVVVNSEKVNLTGAKLGRGLDYFTNPATQSFILTLKFGF